MGSDPDIQRVQRRRLSMFRHLFRALPHHGDEAAQIRHTVSSSTRIPIPFSFPCQPSLARYGAALRQHAHAPKLDRANSQLAARISHASFITSRIMGVGVAHFWRLRVERDARCLLIIDPLQYAQKLTLSPDIDGHSGPSSS